MTRPNILLITTDEERYALPEPDGFVLPARERLVEMGTSFQRHYVASAQCSSSRSVIYTGQHMPIRGHVDQAFPSAGSSWGPVVGWSAGQALRLRAGPAS